MKSKCLKETTLTDPWKLNYKQAEQKTEHGSDYTTECTEA